jgi:hypothetical protein
LWRRVPLLRVSGKAVRERNDSTDEVIFVIVVVHWTGRSGIMSILDGLLKQAVGAVDIQQIAERVGLPADKVESAVAALGAAHHEPTDTVQTASGQTGIEPGKLQEIMQHLGGEEALGKIASLLGQSGGGNPLGGLSSFLRE